MSSEPPIAEGLGQRLATALRAIRRLRGRSTAELASLMGMDRRNYANFEAGKGRLNMARILRFAEVTDSDPWAILAGVMMGSPRLALDAANNKLVMAFLILLAEFEGTLGEGLRDVDTAEAVSAFGEAFRVLEAVVAAKHERLSADWLRTGAAKIGLAVTPTVEEDEGSD